MSFLNLLLLFLTLQSKSCNGSVSFDVVMVDSFWHPTVVKTLLGHWPRKQPVGQFVNSILISTVYSNIYNDFWADVIKELNTC